MKILSQLLVAIKPLQVVGDTNKEITDVINDSRQARPGVMFIAVKGVAVDSHRFFIMWCEKQFKRDRFTPFAENLNVLQLKEAKKV